MGGVESGERHICNREDDLVGGLSISRYNNRLLVGRGPEYYDHRCHRLAHLLHIQTHTDCP